MNTLSKTSEIKYNSLKKQLQDKESVNVKFKSYGNLNVRIRNTTIYESDRQPIKGFDISAIVAHDKRLDKYISYTSETIIEALRGFKITLDNYINS